MGLAVGGGAGSGGGSSKAVTRLEVVDPHSVSYTHLRAHET